MVYCPIISCLVKLVMLRQGNQNAMAEMMMMAVVLEGGVTSVLSVQDATMYVVLDG